MRTIGRLLLPVLAAWLVACAQTAPPDGSVIPAAAAAPMPAALPSSTSVADSGLAIAVARESADRAVREQTLRVQKHLREQDHAWKQAFDAAQHGDGNERCMAGQRMRRVPNGWVQAGTC